jgi:hypothetical protein
MMPSNADAEGNISYERLRMREKGGDIGRLFATLSPSPERKTLGLFLETYQVLCFPELQIIVQK